MNIDFVNLTLLLAITHAKTKCVTVLVTDDVNFYLIGGKRKKGGLVFFDLNFHSLRLHNV